MKRPSFSIFTLMFIVAMVAIDFGLLRLMDMGSVDEQFVAQSQAVASVFLMVNILALGLLRIIAARGKNRPFLVGFELAGSLAVIANCGCYFWIPDQMQGMLHQYFDYCITWWPKWLFEFVFRPSFIERAVMVRYTIMLVLIPILFAPFMLIQISVALAGGFLGRMLYKKTRTAASDCEPLSLDHCGGDRRDGLCTPRVPEEIKEGYQDAGGRDERRPTAAQGGGGTP
jgi:hypothetical protein